MGKNVMMFIIRKIEEIVSFILFIGMIGVMSFQIFCRYVLDSPFSWPEELSGYLLVWLAMFGAVIGVKTKSHTIIEFVVTRVNKRVRLVFSIVSFLLISILIWILVITGFIVAQKTSFPTATLPFTWTVVYLAVPIAGFLMFIRFIENFFAIIRRR